MTRASENAEPYSSSLVGFHFKFMALLHSYFVLIYLLTKAWYRVERPRLKLCEGENTNIKTNKLTFAYPKIKKFDINIVHMHEK